jgi:hypothetical protein
MSHNEFVTKRVGTCYCTNRSRIIAKTTTSCYMLKRSNFFGPELLSSRFLSFWSLFKFSSASDPVKSDRIRYYEVWTGHYERMNCGGIGLVNSWRIFFTLSRTRWKTFCLNFINFWSHECIEFNKLFPVRVDGVKFLATATAAAAFGGSVRGSLPSRVEDGESVFEISQNLHPLLHIIF